MCRVPDACGFLKLRGPKAPELRSRCLALFETFALLSILLEHVPRDVLELLDTDTLYTVLFTVPTTLP